MRPRSLLVLLLALLTVSLAACATRSEGDRTTAGKTTAQQTARPSGSLAKVQLGMDDAQVRKILGDPAESNSYMTGKAFIPFYFGPDTHRADWVYPGVGRVVFSRNRWTGGLKVIKVTAEPARTAGAR